MAKLQPLDTPGVRAHLGAIVDSPPSIVVVVAPGGGLAVLRGWPSCSCLARGCELMIR